MLQQLHPTIHALHIDISWQDRQLDLIALYVCMCFVCMADLLLKSSSLGSFMEKHEQTKFVAHFRLVVKWCKIFVGVFTFNGILKCKNVKQTCT